MAKANIFFLMTLRGWVAENKSSMFNLHIKLTLLKKNPQKIVGLIIKEFSFWKYILLCHTQQGVGGGEHKLLLKKTSKYSLLIIIMSISILDIGPSKDSIMISIINCVLITHIFASY